MDPLHLVLGDHGASLLRVAVRRHGLRGDVWPIPDDLSHGPLDDGVARVDWMRRCCVGSFPWTQVGTDAFAPWDPVRSSLQARPRPLVLWGGDTAAEAVFVAMACDRLGVTGAPLHRVAMPVDRERAAVGAFDPPELVARHAHACVPMPEDERADRAALFRALRADPSPRRVLRDGVPTGAPADVFDALLLGTCTDAWRPAAQVVGEAMRRCDPRESVSDVYLGWRLQVALDGGRLQADGARTGLRDFAVRRAAG